jgi:hypothetical protein
VVIGIDSISPEREIKLAADGLKTLVFKNDKGVRMI